MQLVNHHNINRVYGVIALLRTLQKVHVFNHKPFKFARKVRCMLLNLDLFCFRVHNQFVDICDFKSVTPSSHRICDILNVILTVFLFCLQKIILKSGKMDHIELDEETNQQIDDQTEEFGRRLEEIVLKLKQHYIKLKDRNEHLKEILRELEKIANDTHLDVSLSL